MPLTAPRLIDDLERAATTELLGLTAQWPCIRRYQTCAKLGQGGMSTVWEAHDMDLGRRVAIKLLRPDLPVHHGARLQREAQALAKLSHPNVVQVYEAVQIEGLTAVVMELLHGATLRSWQEREPRPAWKRCVEVYLHAGRGLAAAHAAGLVHRDFKPDNCIVDAAGRVRVLDFGLVARTLDDTVDEAESRSQDDSLEIPLTGKGTLLGTVAYMPPERLGLRASADAAAGDQFSFCTSLYEAIYGERPFGGGSEEELAAAIEHGRVRAAPRSTRTPRGVRRILLRGLAAEPGRRWRSMEELLAELERTVASTKRWRRLGVTTVSSMVVVASMAATMREGTARQPCTGAWAQLDGVWDEDRRQAVAGAIRAETQHAIDTWARIEPALDEYSQRWVAKHTQVCEATRVNQSQTEADMGLRMRCLSDRRIALREAVVALQRPEETTRASAVALVAGLPALSQCDDLEGLQAETLPPGDPDQAMAVEAARASLSRVRALRETGAHAASEKDANCVVEEARRIGYQPLIAEALLERGEILAKWPDYEPLLDPLGRTQRLRHERAEADLEEAHDLAVKIEHRHVETRAASLLARLVAHDLSRLDAADRWGRTASSLAERPGTDGILVAEAASAMGSLVMKSGRHGYSQQRRQEMLALYGRALALYEDALGPSHPAVAETFESAGDALLTAKDPERAQEQYEQALALYEASLGSSHPAVATVLWKLGKALTRQGEPDVALAVFERVLEIQHAALGTWHPSVARTWSWIGIAFHMQGRLKDAHVLHRLALDMMESTSGRENPDVIGILSELGFVRRDQGRIEDALPHYERSIQLRSVVEPSSISLVLTNIGQELLDHGRPDLADEYLRRALALVEARASPRHITILLVLGEVAVAQRDHAGAIQYVERAFSLLDESYEHSPFLLLSRGRFVLARALWAEPARRDEARYLAEQARDGYRDLGGESEKKALAAVNAWLETTATRWQ